ncbi:MAG: helix-turn-helix domain-containing protein [Agriterribacter sp.]
MNDIQTVLKSAGESIAQLIGREVEVFYRLKDNRVNVTTIWNAVLAVTGVSDQSIMGKARYKEIVSARQLFCYLAKRYTGLTLVEIGKYLGGRDHTTVIHSLQRMNELIDSNDDIVIDMIAKVEAYFSSLCINPLKQAS